MMYTSKRMWSEFTVVVSILFAICASVAQHAVYDKLEDPPTQVVYEVVKTSADSTTEVTVPTGTRYNYVLFDTPVSFKFADSTQSLHVNIHWDSDHYYFSGITYRSGYTGEYTNVSGDSATVVLAWPFPVIEIDSLFTIWMSSHYQGTGFMNLSGFYFNERGNDGLENITILQEIRPFRDHPTFADEFWSKESVIQNANEHLIERWRVGDTNCSMSSETSRPSSSDALDVLRRSAFFNDDWEAEDPIDCPINDINNIFE